jgi:pimeloyl-ACP methyl ester carboxylesterase
MRSSRLLPALLILLAGCAAVRRPAPPGPAVPREGYVTSGAVRIFYRMVGNGPDTVLVVHDGPGLHHGALAPDLRPLLRGRTLVFYDQRGGGRSTPAPEPGRFVFQEHLSDLRAVVRHLRLGRFALVGFGWGAGMAAVFAEGEEERVARLALVSPVPPRSDPYVAQTEAEVARRLGPERRARLDALLEGWKQGEDPNRLCRQVFALRAEAAGVEPLRRPRGRPCAAPPEALRAYPRTVERTRVAHRDWRWLPLLRRVKVPTLVVRGEHDPVPAAAADEWVAAVPGARLLVVPGAAALPHVERPEIFFPGLQGFLAESTSAR